MVCPVSWAPLGWVCRHKLEGEGLRLRDSCALQLRAEQGESGNSSASTCKQMICRHLAAQVRREPLATRLQPASGPEMRLGNSGA